MAKGRHNKPSTKIESLKHKDKRANIPTEELRDFVAEDERKPKTVTFPGLLYARDPSLDPQLVWKGKDEQDRHPLEVPVVPIYIQEKIHPHALIQDLQELTKMNGRGESLSLFADFNGIKFEDLVDFYAHKDGVNWSNRLILGDSLFVMTSLAEKEGLKSKFQMIYMDPPYGIKFGSNWQVSTRKRDVKDGKVADASREPEVVKAFRDTWKLGIHSYLGYLRDRLTAARELLTETGSVFVQIGDENVHLVRSVMDEVFGAGNFVCQIAFVTTGGQSAELLGNVFDFLVWYAKDKANAKYRQLFQDKELREGGGWAHAQAELEDGTRANIGVPEVRKLLGEGKRIRPYSLDGIASQGTTASSSGPFEFDDRVFTLPHNSHWKTNPEGMKRLVWANRIESSENSIRFVRFLDDFPVQPITNVWDDTNRPGYVDEKRYVVQTSAKVIERCLLMTTDPGDLVLDPTCGSGTTAYVAEQWGRRWITIDSSRVALALARTRLMAARYPYYVLADSPEGTQKEAEITGSVPAAAIKTELDIKKGFVCKRVPHVTLKSIANNPEIKKGMTREQIDAAIARHAETETLFDRPYEDNKRVRVAGPFTVESLSPYRVLSTDEDLPKSEQAAQEAAGAGQFETMIIENLRKAGVQNTIKNERLKFDRLESFANTWIQAAGEYTESGKTKRVAISIGPEHGTVGPDQVKDAAKEAVQGIGFDLLIVCGFAFDPHVSEEAKRYGKLNVLIARMNPDLSMGDELLKKTGAGNLFMVFGEPDIDIKKQKDGKFTAEIRGVDVYDPTTGQIRSHSTDDIACWFIDTSYNGESFFVRHAYFTGADEPYEKLKRALRAEINESAWSALYSTKSRPFDTPKTGKIAIKVINHYGDEALKVYSV
ncbi:MAG TPA: site-specific DNA-methyltransferase [Terriglobales bacterium]|jgi:adenine-specific DNA-methyltransferase|nr:site-specific DNA-methyltransferase [Terriglobales bacterium]